MSKESLQKFINDSQKDKKLKKISEESRKKFASKEERFGYVVEEAKKLGYDFTVDDMLNEMEKNLCYGFSDDELSNVAGGASGGFLSSSSNQGRKETKNFFFGITGKNQ